MTPIRINPGVFSAISAGVPFGASTPLAKSLVHGIDPWMLAGLLYLGSGIGLGADGWWLAAAISAGGIVAPVLMMYGLSATAASSASLTHNHLHVHDSHHQHDHNAHPHYPDEHHRHEHEKKEA
jgi:ABC-type nickel/cobalt efflux system permease component RcnA